MQTEIEAKFLHVDHEEIREKLMALGAVQKSPMRLMKRKNYDYPDGRLEKIGGWVRLRGEGDKTTLSYKQVNDRTVQGTQEVSLTVDDFETSDQFLTAIGLQQKSYQETRRESWELDGCQVELDEWPWVRPFLEIETVSEQELRDLATKLGFDMADAAHGSVEIVYRGEYNVTDAEVNAWPVITFSAVPDWLEVKRR